jgi:glycosyltransferase involved in cell wall biosynthesis
MLSIVIPSFNEEKYLPFLLDSIKKQEIKCEIIIADSSTKKINQLAKKYKCKLVKGANPAKARNNGAKIAKHDILFLDADVIIPDGEINNFLIKIKEKNLDYATCRVVPYSKNLHHKFVYMLKNYGNRIFPNHVSGQCLFVKKTLLEKVKGFDEFVIMGEEHELAQRLSKSGKGKFFMDVFVYNFPRRHEKEGTYRTVIRDIYSELNRMLFGPLRHELYRKRYGHY